MLRCSRPGRPDPNAHIERFYRRCRIEAVDAYVDDSLHEVSEITVVPIREYIDERPHDSLGRAPPRRSC